MERDKSLEKIEKRITGSIMGTVFVTSDFVDIASADTANRALLRLVEKGLLRKIVRGVYEWPETNSFLKERVAVSPDKVAQAIARNNNWTIVPSGNTSLNMLGLSTQVPAVWTYVSDGPYKEYRFDKVILKFKHTANKEVSSISYKSALVIQAIKALGKSEISDKVVRQISSLLTDEEKKAMLIETQYTTAWIYDVIREIALNGESL